MMNNKYEYAEQYISNIIIDYADSVKKEKEELKKLEKLRKSFVDDYPIDKILSLKLNDYCIGLKNAGYKNYRTFCYRIENELDDLGDMHGARADKFGVYYGEKEKDSTIFEYKVNGKFGKNYNDAFITVKKEIVNLLKNGAKYDKENILKSKIAPLYRYKLLSTYYPDKYIDIFSEDHVNEFLEELHIHYDNKISMIDKQEILINLKNQNDVSKQWTLDEYMRFLYRNISIPSRQKTLDKEAQKERDKNYPKEHQYNIKISKKDWEEMLRNNKVFNNSNIELLKVIYNCDNHASTCKNLEIINGVSPQTYNKQVVELAKRILTHIGKKPDIRSNGKERFWNVIFWGRRTENGLFEWKIKPKLAEALIDIYPDLEAKKINDVLDDALTNELKTTTNGFSKVSGKYKEGVVDKPKETIIKGTTVYKRNRETAINALKIANYKCEICSEHKTFIRKRIDINYTEPHHLIPMANQPDFDVSIDVEENIVSLCSNCHNEIHYGRNADNLVKKLYKQRKELLKNKKINIDLAKLLSYYGYNSK